MVKKIQYEAKYIACPNMESGYKLRLKSLMYAMVCLAILTVSGT